MDVHAHTHLASACSWATNRDERIIYWRHLECVTQKQATQLLTVHPSIADFLASERAVQPQDAALLARFFALTAAGNDPEGREAVLRQLNQTTLDNYFHGAGQA